MKNLIRNILILFSVFLIGKTECFAQDTYNQCKNQYDRLRKVNNQDSALIIAKQMNAWALKNETDTSLRYAVSLRYVGNCFNRLSDLDSAIFYLNLSNDFFSKQKRQFDSAYIGNLNEIGSLYYQKDNYEKSEYTYLRALKLCKNVIKVQNGLYATIQCNLGNVYYMTDKLDKAEFYYKSALTIREELFGVYDPSYIDNLLYLGYLYQVKNDFDLAESYYKSANELIKIKFGNKDNKYAESLSDLGSIARAKKNYNSAILLYEEALGIRSNVFGEKNKIFIDNLEELGDLYYRIQDYGKAEYYYRLALKLRAEISTLEDKQYGRTLKDIGNVYFYLEKFNLAETYYKQALNVIKKNLGEEHEDYAESLELLGYLYSTIDENKLAEPLLNSALKIYKNTIGTNNSVYGVCLSKLAEVNSALGDYTQGINGLLEASDIIFKNSGSKNNYYATNIYTIAELYYNLGKYKLAEQFYKKSLFLFKQILNEKHEDYSNCLLGLGKLYSSLGQDRKAFSCFDRYLKNSIKTQSENSRAYAIGLYYLGNYMAEENRHDTALILLKKALTLLEADKIWSLATNLSIGDLYLDLSDFQNANLIYQKSLNLTEEVYGKDNVFYASALNSMGLLFWKFHEFENAKNYFQKATEIYRMHVDTIHPYYIIAITNLARLYEDNSDFASAIKLFENIFNLKVTQIKNNFSWLSGEEKTGYWSMEKSLFNQLNNFACSAYNSLSHSTILSYNANLISKSLLLETSKEIDNAVAQSKDVELKIQFNEMKQLRRVFNKMQSEFSDKKEIMQRYKEQADSLDKILVNSLGEYAESKRKFEINWKDIQANLGNNEAALEFARFYDDKDHAYKYMALVVRPEYKFPKLVKLGDEHDIKTQVLAKNFSELYPLVWQGIDSLLSGIKTVYYSPVGELNNVSFSALCYGAKDTLLAVNNSSTNRSIKIEFAENNQRLCSAYLIDKYQLHQLATTRYLADGTLKKEKLLSPSIALIGGINYDELPQKNTNADKEQSNNDYILAINIEKENNEKRSSLNKGSMPYLVGTKTEVTNIAGLLVKYKWNVQTRTDKKAEEFALKKDLNHHLAGVLHIATHGFVLRDENNFKKNTLEIGNKIDYNATEDPMVRCGLMLSGSNISWTGNPQKMIEHTGDDGILTAAEVANLDLSNTKLVVLSACETGLGKIEGSEGTFGLKRGFKLAGVEQMIVSLWSVPDKETMELMTLFYSDLTKTLNPVSSFEKAQKEMRNKYPTEPEKWAGFVLVR